LFRLRNIKLLQFFKRIAAYILRWENMVNNWGQYLLYLIPILLTIPPITRLLSSIYFVILVIIVSLVASAHATDRLSKYKSLEEEKNKLSAEREHLSMDLEGIPIKVIKSIYNYLNFSYKDRITIYRFNDLYFVPVGRFSINQNLRKYGRKQYPKDQGFIGKSWNEGAFFIEDLPDPERARQKYLSRVTSECNIDLNTLESIGMKSRAYYCKNLLYNGDPIAVIVFESTDSKLPASKEQIDTLLDGPIGDLLVEVIKLNLPLGRE